MRRSNLEKIRFQKPFGHKSKIQAIIYEMAIHIWNEFDRLIHSICLVIFRQLFYQSIDERRIYIIIGRILRII